MVRIQIYLTVAEHKALRALTRRTGISRSKLIRRAIDAMLGQEAPLGRNALIQARGLWSERQDLPDFAAVRRGMNRSILGLPDAGVLTSGRQRSACNVAGPRLISAPASEDATGPRKGLRPPQF